MDGLKVLQQGHVAGRVQAGHVLRQQRERDVGLVVAEPALADDCRGAVGEDVAVGGPVDAATVDESGGGVTRSSVLLLLVAMQRLRRQRQELVAGLVTSAMQN